MLEDQKQSDTEHVAASEVKQMFLYAYVPLPSFIALSAPSVGLHEYIESIIENLWKL